MATAGVKGLDSWWQWRSSVNRNW